jgi:protein-disulfide isomerase
MTMLKQPVSAEDHAQGSENAAVTLVEYGDYECPHCAHAHQIVKSLQRRFGQNLRYVFRNFPLTQSHPHAEAAAETAEFAGAHGKFWEMHDLLFENQSRLGIALFEELARQLELSATALRAALESAQFAERVRADFKSGVRSGVNGTPTFFINGQRHDGSWEFAELLLVLDQTVESAHNSRNSTRNPAAD